MKLLLSSLTLIAAIALLASCDVDSYLDPSNVGRWEHTPVVLPILERLDVIDEPQVAIAGLSEVTDSDLIPEVTEYTIGPGDIVNITIFELLQDERDEIMTRRVSEVGTISLPVIRSIRAAGLTPQQLEEAIADEAVRQGLFADDPDARPVVTVVVEQAQQRVFSIFGVETPGPYFITRNDFRLIDAIALGGGLPPKIEKVYVIRQVALYREAGAGSFPEPDAPQQRQTPSPAATDDPAALLESLAEPEDAPDEAEQEPQPQPQADPPPTPLERAADADAPQADTDQGQYVYVNGEWVLVKEQQRQRTRTQAADAGGTDSSDQVEKAQLMTQRVIEIDAEALMRGEARWNIAIHPDDIIRVPAAESGVFYVGGSVMRPGSYDLPYGQRITLSNVLVAASGGLDPIGYPERVDLTRRIGANQQAIVRLNARAIIEGVQPDVFIKADDMINVGTNLPSSFLAVMRNSFRMSYGFGFLLDRNFGNDVFGPPPSSRILQN